VLSTLWAVDDLSTTLLMERFYRGHLEDRRTPAVALRGAQICLRGATAGDLDLAERWAESVPDDHRPGGQEEGVHSYEVLRTPFEGAAVLLAILLGAVHRYRCMTAQTCSNQLTAAGLYRQAFGDDRPTAPPDVP
jgi:CHAT domain-containing protein